MSRGKLFKDLLRGCWQQYLVAVGCVVLSAIMGFILPLVIRAALDNIIGSEPATGLTAAVIEAFGGREALRGSLWIAALVLVALNILNGVFLYGRGDLVARSSETFSCRLRDELYSKLQNMTYDYHVKAETGDLIQRCTSDVETVRRFLSMQLVEMGRSVSMVIVALIIMFQMDVGMTLVSAAALPIVFFFALIFFKNVTRVFRQADAMEGELSTVLQENLTGIRVVRAFGRQKFEADKFEQKNSAFRDLINKLNNYLALYWGFADGLCLIQIGIVLVVGAYRAATGSLTLGTLLVFTTYEGMLLWPCRNLGRMLADMGKAQVSLHRIEEILYHPVETQAPGCIQPPIEGDIAFDDVSFGYNKKQKVLKHLSFTVKQGQTVAILGATGAGKSTLVHLLQRLYDPDSGRITIGGTDLTTIDKKWLRQHVGIVLQEPYLYSRTIRENVKIVTPGSPDDAMFEATRIASIHEVIESFDHGYDTAVGERGVTLSGGQKQRVAIARTLMQDCPILIFDDSLSAVDTKTDAAIREALNQRKQGITTFIISHRTTTLMQADLILVLEDGRITQQGTHGELLEQPGLYQRVWSIQNALESEMEGGCA